MACGWEVYRMQPASALVHVSITRRVGCSVHHHRVGITVGWESL